MSKKMEMAVHFTWPVGKTPDKHKQWLRSIDYNPVGDVKYSVYPESQGHTLVYKYIGIIMTHKYVFIQGSTHTLQG